uniref:Glutaredoxin domain-containing protein n=1 Tax=viral metagenome TaxID=1070528 RepID=A0A6C0B062_9ZZZZ
MNNAIYFGSPGCGACQEQEELLRKSNIKNIKYVNIDRFPDRFRFIRATPTWAFPQGNESYKLHEGIINPELLSFGRRRNMRRTRFGETPKLLPNINDLAVYGKNFPNGKGFEIPDSYYKKVESVWGTGNDTLNAGIGGTRSLGPDNIGEMYSNGYFNNIRMAQPADQLGTALYLNRSCNITRNEGTTLKSPGMIYDSPNPQIVDTTTGFGRRRKGGGRKANLKGKKRGTRFGGLYGQMGPAYEIGNQYLINKDTGNQLYSGGRQNKTPRPDSVQNKYIYVGQVTPYKPIGNISSFPSFGKKSKKKQLSKKQLSKKQVSKKQLSKKQVSKKVLSGKKAVNIKISIKRKSGSGKRTSKNHIGEGTTLKIKGGKIKVKN